jgi:hypothetical protein
MLRAAPYVVGVDLDFDRFDPSEPPVVLVGGLNLVRALGLGGLEAVVAHWDPEEPAFASRYCRGRLELPRPGSDGAAADALVALGAQLAGRLDVIDPLAMWVLYLRLGQSVTHLVSTSVPAVQLRATLFFGQMLIYAWWGIQLLG